MYSVKMNHRWVIVAIKVRIYGKSLMQSLKIIFNFFFGLFFPFNTLFLFKEAFFQYFWLFNFRSVHIIASEMVNGSLPSYQIYSSVHLLHDQQTAHNSYEVFVLVLYCEMLKV